LKPKSQAIQKSLKIAARRQTLFFNVSLRYPRWLLCTYASDSHRCALTSFSKLSPLFSFQCALKLFRQAISPSVSGNLAIKNHAVSNFTSFRAT